MAGPEDWGAVPVDPSTWGAKPVEQSTEEKPADRSYLSRVEDIPSDIKDIASSGLKTLADAPGKIAGTETENKWNELVPNMIKMGVKPEKAQEIARTLQRNEGFYGLVGGPLETVSSILFGPFRSMASRPVEEKTGIPKEVTELGASMLMGRPRFARVPRQAPLTQALRAEADAGYTTARAFPIEFHDQSIANMANGIRSALQRRFGYRENVAGGTLSALDYMAEPSANGRRNIADIDSIRQNLGHIARQVDANGHRTSDAGAASHAIEMLDNSMLGLGANDIASGTHLLPDMLSELNNARGNYAAYMRSDVIDRAIDRAQRQAAASGTGANIDNVIRQRFNSILNNPRLAQRYTDNELAMIREVAEGNVGRNTGRYLGRLSPSGIVSATGSAALGHLLGVHGAGQATLPTIGAISKTIADARTRAAAQRVSEAVRQRSPLFRQTPLPPSQFRFNPYPLLGRPSGNVDEEE